MQMIMPLIVVGAAIAGALFWGSSPSPTFKLPVRLRIRPYPTRPLVEVEDASHPAARHQHDGVAPDELRQALTPLFAELA